MEIIKSIKENSCHKSKNNYLKEVREGARFESAERPLKNFAPLK